jgi:hypothetical protein
MSRILKHSNCFCTSASICADVTVVYPVRRVYADGLWGVLVYLEV